jgi:hypothetical protein
MIEQVAVGISDAGCAIFENIAVVVHYELKKELQRLSGYIETIKLFLSQTEQQFAPSPDLARPARATVEASSHAILTATEAQVKLQTYYATTMRNLATTITADLNLPTLALRQCNKALLALSQARNIRNDKERVDLFKASYIAALEEDIVSATQDRQLVQRIDEQVGKAFTQVKYNIDGISQDVTMQVQSLLSVLRDTQERRLLLAERDLKTLQEMQRETQSIIQDAERLTAQLGDFVEN